MSQLQHDAARLREEDNSHTLQLLQQQYAARQREEEDRDMFESIPTTTAGPVTEGDAQLVQARAREPAVTAGPVTEGDAQLVQARAREPAATAGPVTEEETQLLQALARERDAWKQEHDHLLVEHLEVLREAQVALQPTAVFAPPAYAATTGFLYILFQNLVFIHFCFHLDQVPGDVVVGGRVYATPFFSKTKLFAVFIHFVFFK